MEEIIVGRKAEIELLNTLRNSSKSEFVAVYGRRRIGKTFLIRNVFENEFCFQLTGIANVNLKQQLANFHSALLREKTTREPQRVAKDWFEAFQQLITYLENLEVPKKVIFLDELPWLDTTKSNFIPALEHFWNSWASARRDILLVVCGSAASWMINNLINNKGGLHNRVTHRLKLEPFTLAECEAFFLKKNAVIDRYQLIQLYMVTGGVPFYLEHIEANKSTAQNIDNLCFTKNSLLRTEFDNLYSSLFKKADKHILIVETLAKKAKGMSREELIQKAKLTNGGNATKLLQELEESSFIRRYHSFEKKEKNSLYQLCDFYSLFYLKFIKETSDLDENTWLKSIDNPQYRAWSGYAFEQVCLAHTPEIKRALGISGIQTHTSAWLSSDKNQKAQIDLVIDRRDHVINLCEMKFSLKPFTIDKKYAEELASKVEVFRTQNNTTKALFLTMITTFGVVPNTYSNKMVQQNLTMDIFFK